MSVPTILVVEDYDSARKALCAIVGSFGATAMGAANGEEALLLAAARKPHLVFCDIRMPGMDGFEFLRRLRAIPELASLPVIAMSGLGSDAELAQIEAAGFAARLMKPVLTDVIGAHIESLRDAMNAG
jgi:two-component system CheB/CheR fusion protein